MKRIFLLLVMLSILSQRFCFAADFVSALVDSNNTFAFDLYAKLKATDGNLLFSPYSISTCLAMTYAGARGETATQMEHTLHFAGAPVELPARFAALQKQLPLSESGVLSFNIADGLWAQKTHPFQRDYLEEVRSQFGAKLEQVDFLSNAEEIRSEINSWVSEQTQGRIADLLAKSVLTGQTRLVLVNAIYFKGKWENPFQKQATSVAQFCAPDKCIPVSMMTTQAQFNYAETDSLQLLELPYATAKQSSVLSLVVILPKTNNNLATVEGLLTGEHLNHWLKAAHLQKVQVFLPKFKTTGQLSLSGTLASMGMPMAFSPQADFSGMDGRRDLFISAVVHQAFVEVNEEGTEAAAATGTVVTALSAMRPHPIPIFRADHPFIFLIRDNQTGSILFLGRITNPNL